jgi:hypothetical protein
MSFEKTYDIYRFIFALIASVVFVWSLISGDDFNYQIPLFGMLLLTLLYFWFALKAKQFFSKNVYGGEFIIIGIEGSERAVTLDMEFDPAELKNFRYVTFGIKKSY